MAILSALRLAIECTEALAKVNVTRPRQLAQVTFENLGLSGVSGGVAATVGEALEAAQELKRAAKESAAQAAAVRADKARQQEGLEEGQTVAAGSAGASWLLGCCCCRREVCHCR